MYNAFAALNFQSFQLAQNLDFDLLLFTNDTIIMRSSSWSNICAIKFVLHGFELASSLRVNFHKIKVLGCNVDHSFLETMSEFLFYPTSSLPFIFQGIPIGINPHRASSWEKVLVKLRIRLAVWKGKCISIIRRVTLINFVLLSLPFYLFSFYRASKIVMQEITNFQRSFFLDKQRKS